MKENTKYDNNHFEKFLREKTDEFVLYPSKRIWSSVYNNLHPSRKWPSISVCILLITALLMVGYMNTDIHVQQSAYIIAGQQKNKQQFINQKAILAFQLQRVAITERDNNKTRTNQFSSLEKSGNFLFSSPVVTDKISTRKGIENKVLLEKNNVTASTVSNQKNSSVSRVVINENKRLIKAASFAISTPLSRSKTTLISLSPNGKAANTNAVVVSKNKMSAKVIKEKAASTFVSNENEIVADKIVQQASKIIAETSPQNLESNSSIANVSFATINSSSLKSNLLKQEINSTLLVNNVALPNSAKSISDNDKAWIEEYAIYNRKAIKKWKGKLGWQLYITPSFSYRRLEENVYAKTTNTLSPLLNDLQNGSVDKALGSAPSYGLETGASFVYPIFKGVKVKAGLQFNYTRYALQAFENFHPIGTSITMNDGRTGLPYQLYASTPYSTTTGISPISLHNQTYQISIPLGVDMKLAGNDQLEWYAGASIQPSFVAGAKVYLISSDRRDYIEDKSMLNKWNMNAGFETYLTYKANGYTWQAGPQYRTQLFTTNTRLYSIQEKIFSVGLKIGVTKTF